MRNIDKKAIKAQVNTLYKEIFISEFESFILNAAYKVSGQYVTKNDDIWSVSLIAFNEAIQSYTYEKGRFLPFAEMVIKRRLYDYNKKINKNYSETPVSPSSFDCETDDDSENPVLKQQILKKTETIDNYDAKWEIEAISGILAEYGFTFFDLVSVSPKAGKTKAACARAIAYVVNNPLLMETMRRTRNLPVKAIENSLQIPRKIIERHRKYIITAIEIISGDYPMLCEYLRFVKEELKK